MGFTRVVRRVLATSGSAGIRTCTNPSAVRLSETGALLSGYQNGSQDSYPWF